MELIQGYVKDNGNVGIKNIERWHDTHVIRFLSEIESTRGIEQLLKVRYLIVSQMLLTSQAPAALASLECEHSPRHALTCQYLGRLGL